VSSRSGELQTAIPFFTFYFYLFTYLILLSVG